MIILLHQKEKIKQIIYFTNYFLLISYDFNFNVTKKYLRLEPYQRRILFSGNLSYREALEDISTSLEPYSLQKCIA